MTSIEPVLGLDTAVFEDIVQIGSPQARQALATELAGMTVNPDTAPGERNQIVPVLLKLAVDPVAGVRRTLAAGLSAFPELHPDLLFTIVSDEDDIALPFLTCTPALNAWQMVAILRVGDTVRQAIVALRHDITPEAVTFAVNGCNADVCAALLDNPAALLGDEHFQTLYTRFGQMPQIVDRLLARHDLPLDIRIMQAKRTSNRMHQLMAEKGWVAANDAAEFVADAEETTVLRILVEASEPELQRTIRFLTAKHMLTPSIILRAACLGEMRVVERALAHLADVPLSRARQMIYGVGLNNIKTLHAKAGLPQPCLGLLRAAAEV